MSDADDVNENLLLEAAYYIDRFTGTNPGKVLERVLAEGDLEKLEYYVAQARQIEFEMEYHVEPDYDKTPERSYIEGGKLEVF